MSSDIFSSGVSDSISKSATVTDPHQLGDVLIKVHEDLVNIRDQLVNSGQSDISAIQSAIEKTETSIKQQTNNVLNVINNQVKCLPSLEEQSAVVSGIASEPTWDMQISQGKASPTRSSMAPRLKERSKIQPNRNQYTFTPAEKHRLKMAQHSIFNPQNEKNRETMKENFGIQLPLLSEQKQTKPSQPKLVLGSTVEPLAALPMANRKDPQLAPPSITEEDARQGILSLLERGLIPPGADLAFEPSPVKHKLAQIYTSDDRKLEKQAIADSTSYNMAGVKLATSIKGETSAHDTSTIATDKQPAVPKSMLVPKQKSIHMPKAIVPQKTLELQLQPGQVEERHRDVPSLPPIDGTSGMKRLIAFFNKKAKQTRVRRRRLAKVVVWSVDAHELVKDSVRSSDITPSYTLPYKHPPPDTVTKSTSITRADLNHLSTSPLDLLPLHSKLSPSTRNLLPPPATPNMMSTDYKTVQHRFPIQHGRTKETTNEYMAFRQHYCLSWGPIITILHKLEKLLQEYAVPIAFVHGDKLADLALEFELELQPSPAELLSTLVNHEDVEALIKTPGQRYRGLNGEAHAATRIQSQYRMYRQRKAYLEYRHRKWAAGVIALTWVMNVKMATMKKQLKVTRKRELENFKERARTMALSWHKIKRSRRVIIHIPSLGYSQRVRDSIADFGTLQNAQMARLCDVRDPNVEVIYVSPVPVNDECMQYYAKLLALKPAVDTGNVEDQAELIDKYKIVIPEAIKSFPTHNMCLSTHLKYSPKALKRIRALIHGREAYIVSGMPHVDDLSVAEFLNVPILGPEPDVAHLYSTKSGSKRIFHSANVRVPPGEYDIYTFPQLHDSLAQLITDNLDVRTWLFKMDHEFDGRGTAYCHVVDHLRCYMWARKECERYGDKWSKKWAQEPVFNKIHSELATILEKHCVPLDKRAYGSWQSFLNAFLSRGGVVEATPASDSVTSLTVDMLIEPDGHISTVSSGDQIHSESPYRCWGLSSPQCSVDPEELNKACKGVAEACKSRGLIGHFAIDFVTFINARTGEQEFWAVDLNLQYNDSTAMNSLTNFITNGTFNAKDHVYQISPPVQENKRRQRRRRHQSAEDELPPTPDRYAVSSTKLLHSNLTVVHYSVFFQMCRAHGIGYDVKEKQGTIFTLIDSFNRENLGMLTIGDNLQGALATFARNMSCIHQEISAPNMQGVTNFKMAIEDMETILGTTIQNANEVDEDEAD